MEEAEGIPPASLDRSASHPDLLPEVKGCTFHPGRENIDWVRLTVLICTTDFKEYRQTGLLERLCCPLEVSISHCVAQ